MLAEFIMDGISEVRNEKYVSICIFRGESSVYNNLLKEDLRSGLLNIGKRTPIL